MIHFLVSSEFNEDVVVIYYDDTLPDYHGIKMIFGTRKEFDIGDRISVFRGDNEDFITTLIITDDIVEGRFLSYDKLNDEEKFAYEIGGIDSIIGEHHEND